MTLTQQNPMSDQEIEEVAQMVETIAAEEKLETKPQEVIDKIFQPHPCTCEMRIWASVDLCNCFVNP